MCNGGNAQLSQPTEFSKWLGDNRQKKGNQCRCYQIFTVLENNL